MKRGTVENITINNRHRRSSDGTVVIMTKHFSIKNGPIRFYYLAVYRAEARDKNWKFLSFKPDDFDFVEEHEKSDECNLVCRYGSQPYAIAHDMAIRPEAVPEELFKEAQLPLLV